MRARLRLLLPPLFVFLGLAIYAKAFADAGDTPQPPTQAQNLAMLWPLLGTLAATIVGWGLPKLTAAYTFFHTTLGAAVIGLIGAVVGGVIPVFQSGSVTWVALAWAAISAATAFFARLNPSTTKEDPPVKSPASKLVLILPLVFAVFAVQGCNVCTSAGTSPTCARKLLTGVDALDGAAARISHRWLQKCGDDARALKDAGKLAEADAAFTRCEAIGGKMVEITKATEDSTQTASDAVDVGEAAGQKDYANILAPVLKFADDLRKVFTDAGVSIPNVTLPGA